ncbi:MAG: nickel pincer cofactor biosynthesis protein LarB [Thermoanaerobaculales bacterium]|jgi:NCAIR mutase (PurE)-related protein|nr:nickel pincer cofactor biosynthesis protein LarB [Thermoanaerobaculales bacterium]
MNRDELRQILEEVASGSAGVNDAAERLASAGIDDLGFARIDTDRERRTGIAEVIFAPGKTDEQLEVLVSRCLELHGKVLVTRLEAERALPLLGRYSGLRFHDAARVLEARPVEDPIYPSVAVVSAGTSDLPVAEEAAVVLEHLGHSVDRVADVGVAGIHRLFSQLERLRAARAIVVAAGMEGALPSVVAGLVDRPVVAVPTSVGYGASFGGVAALLGMLNSCAAGIGVVNIDNGFGAATLVHRIALSDGGEG